MPLVSSTYISQLKIPIKFSDLEFVILYKYIILTRDLNYSQVSMSSNYTSSKMLKINNHSPTPSN